MYKYHQGSTPLLINIPHCGTGIPVAIAKDLTEQARQLTDTDWHLGQLYGFANELGASILQATTSRYVIDLNRPPDDTDLYPGQAGTGLCPTETFAGECLYHTDISINIEDRLQRYWLPYHNKLQATLEQLREQFGYAVLLDAHSICSTVPRLFDGVLPDLNLGTNSGNSCAGSLRELAVISLNTTNYYFVVDGRFKGGYITRHYGLPNQGIHALQLEKTQVNYMNETAPFDYQPAKAGELTKILRILVTHLSQWRP